MGAGLLIHSFSRLTNSDLGFDPNNVETARVTLPSSYSEGSLTTSFFAATLDEIQDLPGVEAATVASGLPFEGGVSAGVQSREGGFAGISLRDVSSGYPEVLGIPTLFGRWITDEDVSRESRVVVVSDSVARTFWPGENPIGREIARSTAPDQEPEWYRVVGVTIDAPTSMGRAPQPIIYSPYTAPMIRSSRLGNSLIIGMKTTPGRGTALVENIVMAREPDSLIESNSMDGIIRGTVERARFQTLVLAAFATVATALAMLGVYSAVAFRTAHRTREVGLRLALGATPGEVVWRIASQGAIPPLVGIGVGLLTSTFLVGFLDRYLSGLEPTESWSQPVVIAIGIGVVVLAAWLPARRAARVDPIVALRYE